MKYLKITLLLLFITVCFTGGGAAVSTPEADEKKEIQRVADEKGITMSALCRMVLKDFMKSANN